ncbi:hypothetical protein Pan5_27 [Pseudanabaena phage Pan5]|nr:hypothetical protein Pan5_27 [Pseudanabaena phage Pan5]
MTTIINKNTNETLVVNLNNLIGKETKSLYVRTGKTNGTMFLSQKNSGANGNGDICKLDADKVVVNSNLFDRIKLFSQK